MFVVVRHLFIYFILNALPKYAYKNIPSPRHTCTQLYTCTSIYKCLLYIHTWMVGWSSKTPILWKIMELCTDCFLNPAPAHSRWISDYYWLLPQGVCDTSTHYCNACCTCFSTRKQSDHSRPSIIEFHWFLSSPVPRGKDVFYCIRDAPVGRKVVKSILVHSCIHRACCSLQLFVCWDFFFISPVSFDWTGALLLISLYLRLTFIEQLLERQLLFYFFSSPLLFSPLYIQFLNWK